MIQSAERTFLLYMYRLVLGVFVLFRSHSLRIAKVMGRIVLRRLAPGCLNVGTNHNQLFVGSSKAQRSKPHALNNEVRHAVRKQFVKSLEID